MVDGINEQLDVVTPC